ncbi:MAG: hypothetical protein NT116_02375 [Candidatus Parcubacteria bacterium]|nr:hypothetical protein [Candidatus Parcubacteria bacterium]
MASSDFTSIFVPYIRIQHDEESVARILKKRGVGEVSKVTLCKINGMDLFRCGYIHLKRWYFNSITDKIYNILDREDHSGKYKLYLSDDSDEFWMLRKMKTNKKSDTDLKIQELTDIVLLLEKEIENMQYMHEMSEKLMGIEQEMEQMRMILSGPLEVLDMNDSEEIEAMNEGDDESIGSLLGRQEDDDKYYNLYYKGM